MDVKRVIELWPMITGALTLIVSGSVAIGAGYKRIESLEQAEVERVQQAQVVMEVREQQAAMEAKFEERTQHMMDESKMQRQLLEKIFMEVSK